ncbi:DUF6912 family protein [Microlunatus sp. Y2014]|uniref:DUF6912 family protein n=1 Tax=Microlunatus sp. Y2014 TaxID=3418488 RepID=UPI003DA73622
MTQLGTETVFVPVSWQQLRELVDRGELNEPLPAYGVTPGLVAWGEFGPGDGEDALFAAQSVAAVAALRLPGGSADGSEVPRVVLAVPAAGFVADADDTLGTGRLPGLTWPHVASVFSDPAGLDLTTARQAAVTAADLGQAWDDPVVADLVDEHDLGWHTPEEAVRWCRGDDS